jgi:hypothetical protein
MTIKPPHTHPMTLRSAPAYRGAMWVRLGFVAFFKHPWIFTGLLCFGFIGLLMLLQIPWIGGLLLLINLPLVSLAFMLASQRVVLREPVSLTAYFSALHMDRIRLRSLWILGLLYALLTLGILVFCHWFDGGKFYALQTTLASQAATAEELQLQLNDPVLQQGVLLCMALLCLRSLLFWHTAGLVYWAGQTPIQALFFNAMALARSKAAFAVYALVCTSLVLSLEWLSWLVVAVLGQPQWAAMLVIPSALVLTCVFYASVFFSFADSFEVVGKLHSTKP